MKKKMRFIWVLLCIVIFFALIAPFAVSSQSSYAEGLDTVETYELDDEATSVMEQDSDPIEQLETGTIGFITSQIEASERFALQVEYYKTCAFVAKNELLRRRITLMQRELEVERVRLSIGESTQNNIDIIKIGLHGNISRESIIAGPFHKNFAEIVYGINFAKLIIEKNKSIKTLVVKENNYSWLCAYNKFAMKILEKQYPNLKIMIDKKG